MKTTLKKTIPVESTRGHHQKWLWSRQTLHQASRTALHFHLLASKMLCMHQTGTPTPMQNKYYNRPELLSNFSFCCTYSTLSYCWTHSQQEMHNKKLKFKRSHPLGNFSRLLCISLNREITSLPSCRCNSYYVQAMRISLLDSTQLIYLSRCTARMRKNHFGKTSSTLHKFHMAVNS